MTEEERKKIEKSRQACLDWYRHNLTKEQLAFVRKCRVDEGHSWRATARACYDEFGEVAKRNASWRCIPSNQIIGMELCEVAAEHFGEHYMQEPWN